MYTDVYTFPPFTGRETTKYKNSRIARGCKQETECGFWCTHCGAYVPTTPVISGVQSRNHCPYCLWSRHLDHYKAGDRLSACKAGMQPIGLMLKHTHNKYARPFSGELMVIHRCNACGKLSINRLAADDLAEVIAEVFHASLRLDAFMRDHLNQAGINPLVEGDEHIVICRLFGSCNLG